jgi:hypothetical protein
MKLPENPYGGKGEFYHAFNDAQQATLKAVYIELLKAYNLPDDKSQQAIFNLVLELKRMMVKDV